MAEQISSRLARAAIRRDDGQGKCDRRMTATGLLTQEYGVRRRKAHAAAFHRRHDAEQSQFSQPGPGCGCCGFYILALQSDRQVVAKGGFRHVRQSGLFFCRMKIHGLSRSRQFEQTIGYDFALNLVGTSAD